MVSVGREEVPLGHTPLGKLDNCGSGSPKSGSPSGGAPSSRHPEGFGGSQKNPGPPGTVQDPLTYANGVFSVPLMESAAAPEPLLQMSSLEFPQGELT